MNATDLLRSLEPLAHDARVRRMVELGRQARSDNRTASLIACLEQGDWYARSLALYSCYGSADGAHALRALADPSQGLRSLALRLVALVCDDVQAQQTLVALPARAQEVLLKRLSARRAGGAQSCWSGWGAIAPTLRRWSLRPPATRCPALRRLLKHSWWTPRPSD
jgi:hypothetical protein